MTIPQILQAAKTIAVVGLSPNPDRSSYGVAHQLIRHGYKVVPVNPRYKKWEGLQCYPYVSQIPTEVTIDMVDVFRRPEATPDVVRDVLKREQRPLCVWLQLGIRSEESRRLATEAGIEFVEDACTAIELWRMEHTR